MDKWRDDNGAGEPGVNRRMVFGLFRDREQAEQAYQSASARGYEREAVNLVITDKTRKLHFPFGAESSPGETLAAEGAGIGAGIGAAIGGLTGILAAAGASVAIPGLGIVIAGPLSAAVAGVGAGGVAGGLLGALVGSDIPEERAREYESGVRDGGFLMGIRPRTAADAEHFESTWGRYEDHRR